MSSDTLVLTSVAGTQPGVTRVHIRGRLDERGAATLILALTQSANVEVRRLEVVLDDVRYFADTGLLGLADAQGYLGEQIVLIYAGRSIGELVRILGAHPEKP